MGNRAILGLLVWILGALSAHAQLKDAESAIKHRRAAFTLMSTYFGRITSMMKGGRPFDRAELIRNVELVQFISKLPWEGFAPGSECGDTRAEPDIWLDEDRFKGYQERLQQELNKLLLISRDGDLPAITQAFEATRDSCGACHKVFRRNFERSQP